LEKNPIIYPNNLTLNDIDAMLASHVGGKFGPGAGYSIFVIGDSSILGTLVGKSRLLYLAPITRMR
jgi:hypothetical protein